jgi:hypothetical protein
MFFYISVRSPQRITCEELWKDGDETPMPQALKNSKKEDYFRVCTNVKNACAFLLDFLKLNPLDDDVLVYRALVGKPDGKRSLARTRRRWEDKIKMDFSGMGWGSMDWIDVAEARVKLRALLNAGMTLGVS